MNFEVEAVVEIPFGSMYKYEIDKKHGTLTVDRPLPVPLPYNYGFVPHTLHDDGDPLDVCIIGKNPIFPLTHVKIIVLGAFLCDDNGFSDDKLVAHVVGEKFTEVEITNAKAEIEHYLATYKPGFTVKGSYGPEQAYQVLMKDVQAYQDGE